jgi:hypothetical protein
VVVDAETPVMVVAPPLKVTLTFCVTLADPNGTLMVSGFGLATRPELLPVPTLRVTWKLNDPTDVLTVTVPKYVPDTKPKAFAVTVTLLPELNA